MLHLLMAAYILFHGHFASVGGSWEGLSTSLSPEPKSESVYFRLGCQATEDQVMRQADRNSDFRIQTCFDPATGQ